MAPRGCGPEPRDVLPEKQIDHQQQIKHFQTINAANVTNTANILLTLSVALIAFGVNIVVNAQRPLTKAPRNWLIVGLAALCAAALTGITILYTRLEDYRRTIRAATIMRDNPGVVTDPTLIESAIELKRSADRLNKATNILLYVLPALFAIGFLCLTASVLAAHWAMLFPG